MIFPLLVFATSAPKPEAQLLLPVSEAVPGQIIRGVIQVTLPSGYHAYQNPPTQEDLIPLAIEGDSLMDVRYPGGNLQKVPGYDQAVGVYSGLISIPVTFRASSAGVDLSLRYQLCNDQACLPPASLSLAAAIKVGSAVPAAQRFGMSLRSHFVPQKQ